MIEAMEETDHFSDSAIEDVCEGEISEREKAVGFHYEGIGDAPGQTVAVTKSTAKK